MFQTAFSISSFRSVATALAMLALAACGFEPLYGDKGGVETSADPATIKVDPIKDRVGQLLRNQLLDTLTPMGEPSKPVYRLIVEIVETKQELAVRKSELATRSNMLFTANYRLTRFGSEGPILSRSSSVSASYNLLNNDFANLSSEADARERGVRELSQDIARQLSLYFRSQAKAERR